MSEELTIKELTEQINKLSKNIDRLNKKVDQNTILLTKYEETIANLRNQVTASNLSVERIEEMNDRIDEFSEALIWIKNNEILEKEIGELSIQTDNKLKKINV